MLTNDGTDTLVLSPRGTAAPAIQFASLDKLLQHLVNHPLRLDQFEDVTRPQLERAGVQLSSYSLRSQQDVLRVLPGSDFIAYVLTGRALVGTDTDAVQLISCGEPLRLEGEKAYWVASLSTPDCQLAMLHLNERPTHELLDAQDPDARSALEATANFDDYYCGYDERYQAVYRQHADLWESDQPNQSLQGILRVRPELLRGKLVDLGCGEGRDSLYLASLGAQVLGVDISRAALDKGRERATRANLTGVSFVESDVVYLRNIPNSEFDFALNMGCLHMLTEPRHRQGHIRRVFQILKPGGYFLVDHCQRNWGKGFFSIPDFDAIAADLVPGREIPRRIRTADGMKFVPLKVLPFQETLKDELVSEICAEGFETVDSVLTHTEAFGDSALVLFRKPLS